MWKILGIARTKDAKAIRRAYASKLKTLDPDADPRAFQQLRSAYEAAIAYSQRPDPVAQMAPADDEAPAAMPTPDAVLDVLDDDPDAALEPPLSEPPPFQPPAVDAPTEEERDSMRLRAAIAEALDAGRGAEAVALFQSALARGYVGIAEREQALEWLMPAVIADKSLGASQFLDILNSVGWGPSALREAWPSQTRRMAAARAEADAWFVDLRALASRPNWPWSKRPKGMRWPATFFESRAARFLLQGRQYVRLSRSGAVPLERLLTQYHSYVAWTGHRFESRFVARAEQAVLWEENLRGVRFAVLAATGILIAVGIAVAGIISVNPVGIFGALAIGRWVFAALSRRRT